MAVAAEGMNQDYLRNIAGISKAFQPMNTDALAATLAQGGSLSGNLGFGDGGISVLGLSPEDVMGLTKQRGDIQNQNQNAIAGMAQLSDLLTGGKATRDALLGANRDMFTQQGAADLQANRLAASADEQAASLAQRKQEQLDRNAYDRDYLKQRKEEARLDRESAERRNNDNIKANTYDKEVSLSAQRAKMKESAIDNIGKILGAKEHTEADADFINQNLMDHPDLYPGQIFAYEDPVFGSPTVKAVQMTKGVAKDGSQFFYYKRPDGNYITRPVPTTTTKKK